MQFYNRTLLSFLMYYNMLLILICYFNTWVYTIKFYIEFMQFNNIFLLLVVLKQAIMLINKIIIILPAM